jgi:anaerobic selenocysteine-containing dehydrogenase
MTDHFERGDLLGGYLQAQPFLRYAPAVVPPLGERRPQWWIFAELARRMGMPAYGSARRDAALAGREVDDETIAESLMSHARRPWDEVRGAAHGIRDESIGPGWLVPGRLPQRLDLAPAALVAQLQAAPPAPAGEPHGGLVLVNRRTNEGYNTLHSQVVSRGRRARPSLLIHPDDATMRGLTSGDVAVVSSGCGSCRAVVEVTTDIRPGVVSLPHGFDDTNVNHLTSTADADRLSGMTVVCGRAVEVSRP